MNEPKRRSFLWTSLPFFILAHFGHHLLTALPLPLLPYIQEEFSLNYTRSAFVTSAFALAGGAAQLPSGWLADRIGPTVLIFIGTFGVAIGGVLIGISHTYVMLLVFMVVMGLASGGYHPAATPLISAAVEPRQRGRALGFHLVGGNASFFLAPLVAGAIAGVWGWRGSYITLAVPTALFGLIFYFYLTKRGGRAHIDMVRRRKIEEKPPQPGHTRRLVAFLVMMVLGGGAGMSLNAFLTLYMVRELGASKELAAMLMSVVFSSGIWAGPMGGYISDRIGSVRVIIVTGVVSGLLIWGLKSATLGFSLYAVLFLMGLNMAVRFPVTEVFIMGQTSPRHRSTIYGVYYFTMQYTGAVFAPIMGGFIDRFGFQTMYSFAAIAVTVVALLTSLFIWDAKDNYNPPTPVQG
ncbi:MAG: MFS transporter [Chloroflexota bacterium]